MKFSVNWLREFVELPANIDELAELLTFAGIEIEGIEQRGANFDKVVVGQILASSPHPNADRLTVCEVDDGSGSKRQIVCGAKNYKVGDKVPVALPGAALPNGLKIKESKLRGVESQGMLCSPSELKMSEESDGLLILAADAKIGAPLSALFPADTILDVEITPNRGDLLSHFGLAREIAALSEKRAKRPDILNSGEPVNLDGGMKISAPRECPFYSARRIENVKIGPSPDWLRARIEAAGVRSLNNIVDISNFVMLELGQPTHAFDADKLKGAINVRLARDGEKFLALDGKTYTLTSQDLVIADEERVVGIGGVMGGEETGVTEATRNVLLEAAYFLPASIRRTARRLNLPSDASYRFERGVDPMGILPASHRATNLMRELAGGSPAAEISAAGEIPPNPPDVSLAYEKCNQLLGLTIGQETVDGILERFGLHKNGGDATKASWQIPSYRADLKRGVDLMEEVVRAYGVEKIPSAARSRFAPRSEADRAADSESALRQKLAALGIYEARTSALIPRGAVAASEGALEVRNPLSEEHVVLRPSLIRGLLDVLKRNVNMGAESIRFFELGRVFLPPCGEEQRALGLLFSGSAASAPHWRAQTNRQLDFFDLKGALEALRIPDLGFRRSNHPAFALAAEITSAGQTIGLSGQLSAAGAAELGASAAVFLAQLNVEALLQSATESVTFREIEKYPSVTRDIAMIVPAELNQAEILALLRSSDEPLLANVQLFDLFHGKEGVALGAGRKSMAYTLTYRDRNRTLTNDEVTVVHTRIRERLKRELGAELRE